MKKRFLSLLIVFCLIISTINSFPVLVTAATTYTSGYYTYEVYKNEAIIIKGDPAISGSVTIPSSLGGYTVTEIRYNSFKNCDNISSLVISSSVKSIGSGAFYDCDGLKTVTISGNNLTMNTTSSGAFANCDYLETVTIGNGVKTIGYSAFSNCARLKNVTISDSVTQILGYAFDGCVKLENMKLGANIEIIDYHAFEDCESMLNVTLPNTLTEIDFDAFRNCDGMTSVTIPSSVKTIGSGAFYDSDGLKTVTISGNNLTMNTTSSGAFANCDYLETVTIGNGVKTIGYSAFSNCARLKNVTISDSVTSIYSKAFDCCSSLVKITIPDGVTSIDRSMFYGCSSLVSITIPNSVTSIGGSAFQDCDSLTSITIPDSVTSIDTLAFYSCNSLVSITIPDSVTNIGDDAFMYCSSLENVIVNEDNSSYSSIDGVLFDKNKTKLLTYPSGKTGGGYTIPDSVTSIGNYAFLECNNLKCICLHQGIKDIEYSAFYGCSNITTVFYAGCETQWNEISFYSNNENLTNAKIIYNATKKIYKFETNCDKTLDDITDYAIFTMPTVQNDGMTLNGWYDNVALSGNPVTFPYYGDATMLYAAWMDGTGKSFDDALIAKANQEYTATTTESGQLVYFEFVPNFSKEYRFYTTGNLDTYGYLYNSDKSQLTSDNDDGDGNNFYISYNLTAGETYYIAAKLYSGTGTFAFVVEEPVDYRINEITLKDMSGNSLQAIPTGTFLATVSFTNVSSSADTVIILAQYTDAGAFKGLMYIQTEDVPTGSTIKLSIPVDNSKGDVAKLKAFCWESFASLTPMGNSASFAAE